MTAAEHYPIPCEGDAAHESAHSQTLTILTNNTCASVTSCPEGSACAVAVEELVDYYERCNVAHDDEDEEFHALEDATPASPCLEHAEHDHDHDDEHEHDHESIPCEGAADHEDIHTEVLTYLADDKCVGLTSCPEGSDCAEAVEALAEYYERCNVGHAGEDAAFVALETADSPCMEHAGHDHDHAGTM